jgi:hypothetical protein
MTNPEFGHNPEEDSEHIPTPEEVHAVFRELAGEKEYKETRKLEDEKGVYVLEIEVPGDDEGQVIEYAYMRKGSYGNMGITATEIHVTYYEDGRPISGTSAAKFENGNWRIV